MHKALPSKNALGIALEKRSSISTVEFDATVELINGLDGVPEDLAWLLTETETFCQERAMNNAMSEAIRIQDNFEMPADQRDKRIPELGAIPEIMKKALSVGFSFDVGHDYWDDVEARWLSYKTKSRKIPFLIKMLNVITKGGVERKTLNLLMAGVNVGKSLGLVHLAAEYMMQGFNVLYVSMEMAEEVVSKRIDANILDIDLDDIDDGVITEGEFMRKFASMKGKATGKLITKQFPTGAANVNHLNNLMSELSLKRKFKPDIVIVDYLGIMASSRMGFSENSYTMVKSIAEELRGFAVDHNVVVWSAAQTNRNGWDNNDVSMSDIAESAGLAATADFILAAMETEEMADAGLQMMKQIKSRYGDKNKFAKFPLGVEKGKQRWYQMEETYDKDVEGASSRMVEERKERVENATPSKKMAAMAAMETPDKELDFGV